MGTAQTIDPAGAIPSSHRRSTPVYRQIQIAIRRNIESGEWKQGQPVASERGLARTHNVSLMTARHALVELEREGLVERRQGAGTFVAAPRIHFNKLMSYTEHMSSRGLSPRSQVLSAKIVAREPEVAARLGLAASNALVRIERVRLTGNDPYALERCYLPARPFAGLVDAPLGRSSLFSTLQHDYGIELAYANEEVDATAAEKGAALLLGLSPSAPVLRIRQVIYSTQGKATIYGIGLYRSERHTLYIRRFRSGES